jgi:hypothetical protein
MTADLQAKSYASQAVLYMAIMELSDKQWRLVFGKRGVHLSAST